MSGGRCDFPSPLKFFSSDARHRTSVQAEVKIDKTAILGAGSWGTALAWLWGKDGRRISLWGNNPERVECMQKTRENSDYIPGLKIPDSVNITHELSDCADADLIVFVTPSTALRGIAMRLRAVVGSSQAALLSCTKGIEHGTGKRMSEILGEIFLKHKLAVLSGPNLAVEVVRKLPTATVIGCENPECAANLQDSLGSSHFRIYTSDDIISIELGGALKNVFAIAAGASDGLGLGDNAKAALITRSLAELIRLGTAMGGNFRTFYGLSGAGDLIATCFSKHSRNRRVGEQLGCGQKLKQITSSMQMVAEGVPTTKSAYECARAASIETPIIDQVNALLYEGKAAVQAMHELLERDQKAEQI
jgi:glycerol-3-phosphate dehydrogenase (NAD(P)+)